MTSGSAAEIGFRRDDAYLREHYRKWLLYRSGWRRWLWLTSLLMVVVGVWLALRSPAQGVRLAALVMSAAGLSQCLLPWLEFRRWKRGAMGNLTVMPDLRLSARDGVLRFGAGPDLRYEAAGDVVPVPGGCFAYQQGRSGRHVYLPDHWRQRPDAQALFRAWRDGANSGGQARG